MILSALRYPHNPATLRLLACAATLAAGSAWSQTGVAPSQTGAFFDDLRNRANLFRSGAVDESARSTGADSGVYDYSRGEYTGESFEARPMEEPGPIGADLIQAIGTHDYKSGYLGSTRRSEGDFTGASWSPYPFTSTYFAPTYLTDPFLAGKRNMKIGPVNIGLGLSANLEYNDNIKQTHDNPIEDLIAGLYLNLDANWAFSKRNRLTLSVTMGFDQYINHPEEAPPSNIAGIGGDGMVFNVFPGSTLAFDFSVGPVTFTLFERVSIRPSSNSQFEAGNEDQFAMFQNDIGLSANWPVNSKLNLSVNFNRADTWETGTAQTSQQEFATGQRQAPPNAYDRTIDTLSGSLAWTPSGTYTIGLEGSLSAVNYKENYNNDSTTLSGGVFVSTPITRNTKVKASGGWQQMTFDVPPAFQATDTSGLDSQIAQLQQEQKDIATNAQANGLTDAQVKEQQKAKQDEIDKLEAQKTATQNSDDLRRRSRTQDTSSDHEDFYYNFTISNQLNARVSQQFSIGHEASLNSNSNYIVADFASYGLGIIAWRGSRLNISSYYENSKESGGQSPENIQQWGADALITHKLMEKLTVSLGYHFGDSDSETPGRDYAQTAYTMNLTYLLTKKLTVGLRFRHLTTDAETESRAFDQNRVTLSMNYNF